MEVIKLPLLTDCTTSMLIDSKKNADVAKAHRLSSLPSKPHLQIFCWWGWCCYWNYFHNEFEKFRRHQGHAKSYKWLIRQAPGPIAGKWNCIFISITCNQICCIEHYKLIPIHAANLVLANCWLLVVEYYKLKYLKA